MYIIFGWLYAVTVCCGCMLWLYAVTVCCDYAVTVCCLCWMMTLRMPIVFVRWWYVCPVKRRCWPGQRASGLLELCHCGTPAEESRLAAQVVSYGGLRDTHKRGIYRTSRVSWHAVNIQLAYTVWFTMHFFKSYLFLKICFIIALKNIYLCFLLE